MPSCSPPHLFLLFLSSIHDFIHLSIPHPPFSDNFSLFLMFHSCPSLSPMPPTHLFFACLLSVSMAGYIDPLDCQSSPAQMMDTGLMGAFSGMALFGNGNIVFKCRENVYLKLLYMSWLKLNNCHGLKEYTHLLPLSKITLYEWAAHIALFLTYLWQQ